MQSKIGKYIVNYFNEEEFHSIKREIFTYNSYYFETNNPSPYILDIGSYVGISVLYFKSIYPNSKIVCFEPNPIAFDLLKENIVINDIKDVEIHNSGIWVENGKKNLYIDESDLERFSVGSFCKNCWNGSVSSQKIEVKVEKLNKYIDRTVDLLKLDVEGSEQRILKSIQKDFKNIRNIVLEYHPTEEQSIKKIIEILQKFYNIEVYEDGKLIKRNIPSDRLVTIKAIYKH